jgi:hypothetical protein
MAHDGAFAHDEAHPWSDELPMDIPPMADMSLRVLSDPQAGQGIVRSRSPVTSSSNVFSHASHLYS